MEKIDFKQYIKTVENWPEQGVSFKDISPLLANPQIFNESLIELLNLCDEFDVVVAPDARGFVFGSPISLMTFKPFVMVRKAGKLPGEVISQSYDLEYGKATLEMPVNSIKKGDKVLIVDDVLATGGTAEAIVKLVESQGAEVSNIAFLIELEFLNGRKNLSVSQDKIKSLIKY